MKLILTVILMGLATGCISRSQYEMNQVEISDFPNAKSAYLIISANVFPSDDPSPMWIALAADRIIASDRRFSHLSTSKDIFELRPGRYKVVHIDVRDNPLSGIRSDIHFWKTPRIRLTAGKIYYYGRLDVTLRKNKTWLRTVRDPALYRRACEYAPELFRQFEVVVIGPIARDDVIFPSCDELLRDSSDQPESPAPDAAEANVQQRDIAMSDL